MIVWEDYLTKMITDFREYFKVLDSKKQEYILKEDYENLPFKPCQIEVLDFGEGKGVALILVHDDSLPDMLFKIRKDTKSLKKSEFIKKYGLDVLGIHELVEKDLLEEPSTLIVAKESTMFTPGRMKAVEVAKHFISDVKLVVKDLEVDEILRSTDDLKKSIAKISEKDLRNELLGNTKKIDQSLREIKRLDKEIGKVRQLVGVTKEFQDWRILVSDVHRLKGEHVPKEVFESEIKRLEDKIKGFNTRIEDLKAIKFWSKRTIVDIILAVIATASTTIVTLIVAGVLKF